jgi:signal transduction histidine kinase
MQWLLADLHIHSTFSDGTIRIEEIIKIYGEAGFDAIAITDHLFDTQSPISLRLREEGKSVKDVETYFRRIEEVSLLSNALKFTPRSGKIEVAVTPYIGWKDGGTVEISIKDTGIGIGEDEIERIFEPFYRGRNSSVEAGTGLGLSFVKEVVDLDGGRILVQSEPQKGSTFSILLPAGEMEKERRWKEN